MQPQRNIFEVTFIKGQETASDGPLYFGTADESSLSELMRNNVILIEGTFFIASVGETHQPATGTKQNK